MSIIKFLIEGKFSDYMTNLKNKVTATYDYYTGKRTNKLGNLEDATAAEIQTNDTLSEICRAFNRANAPYKVQVDRTAKKFLMQFNASQTPKNLIDKFDENKKVQGNYLEFIDSYDSNSGIVDLIFDADKLPDSKKTYNIGDEKTSDVKNTDGTKGVLGKNSNKGKVPVGESILKESFIIVPDSKEAYDIVNQLGFGGSLEIIETHDGPAISGDNSTLSQFIKEYNNEIGEFDLVIKEAFDPFKEQSGFVEIDSKTIYDMDGFLTDYTMYRDVESGEYVFVYGDKETYGPEDGDFDWSCDSEKEAREWFDNYKGFTADEEGVMDDDYPLTVCPSCNGTRFNTKTGLCIDCGYDEKSHGDTGTDDQLDESLKESQISNGHKYTDVVTVDGKKVIETYVASEHTSYHDTFIGYVCFELEDGSDKYYPVDLNGKLIDDKNAWNFIKKQGLPKLGFKSEEPLKESIDVATIADYITDHYDFDDIDDKYACINSIRDSFKDEETISYEVLSQFIGAHNGRDKSVEESLNKNFDSNGWIKRWNFLDNYYKDDLVISKISSPVDAWHIEKVAPNGHTIKHLGNYRSLEAAMDAAEGYRMEPSDPHYKNESLKESIDLDDLKPVMYKDRTAYTQLEIAAFTYWYAKGFQQKYLSDIETLLPRGAYLQALDDYYLACINSFKNSSYFEPDDWDDKERYIGDGVTFRGLLRHIELEEPLPKSDSQTESLKESSRWMSNSEMSDEINSIDPDHNEVLLDDKESAEMYRLGYILGTSSSGEFIKASKKDYAQYIKGKDVNGDDIVRDASGEVKKVFRRDPSVEECVTQSSSVGQYKKASIDLVPDVSNEDAKGLKNASDKP